MTTQTTTVREHLPAPMLFCRGAEVARLYCEDDRTVRIDAGPVLRDLEFRWKGQSNVPGRAGSIFAARMVGMLRRGWAEAVEFSGEAKRLRRRCAWCNSEKVDGVYLSGEVRPLAHNEAFSHGICPSCAIALGVSSEELR